MAKAASDSPHLEAEQQDQAAQHAPLQAIVIHEVIRAEGEAELERKAQALWWSGLAAGLSMGFSFSVQAMLHSEAPAPMTHTIASLGYAVGFVIVVLGRQQLFTESTLSAVLPVLTHRDRKTFLAMLKLWGVVLLANLAGTWLYAAMLAFAHPFGAASFESHRVLALETLGHPFGLTFIKAIVAGWLIALMVWLLPNSGSARILVIGLLAWVVALGRLSHIVAGSSEAAFATLLGLTGLYGYLWEFLAPTLLGNVIGGVALVALLNHAPVRSEMQAS